MENENMRIVKLGMVEETIETCPKCATEFAYLQHDIKTTAGFGYSCGYIYCPACNTEIRLWKHIM
jgi:uncharacterized protein (UPF0212 family)